MTDSIYNSLDLDHLLDDMPGLIWIKDRDSKYVACNKNLIQYAGLKSKKNLLYQSDANLPWAIYAEIYREADEIALSGQSKTFLHPIKLSNGYQAFILSHKMPLYSHDKTAIGIKGSIFLLNSPAQLHSLLKLHKLNELIKNSDYQPIQYIVSDNCEFFNLSKRESLCLFYLIRGKTAKEIAQHLSISQRTVESHIDNIRMKLSCKTKSEIISKALDLGFLYYVPSSFLLNKITLA